MSTGVTPQQSPNQPSTDPISPSSAPASGAAAPTPPAEFRYPDSPDVPAYARGKTASEILGLTQQLYQTVERVVGTTPPAQPPAPPAAPAPTNLADDAYLTGADFRREAQTWAQQLARQNQATWDSVAQTNLELVKRDPQYAPIFAKYGPEVYNTLANVDKSLWNVDNLRKVVRMVKADHVEEIASDLASQRLNEMQPTFRSTGAAPAPVSSNQPDYSLKSEKLPEDYRKRLAETGLTEEALDEFLRANGMSRQDWFNGLSKTAITEGARV